MTCAVDLSNRFGKSGFSDGSFSTVDMPHYAAVSAGCLFWKKAKVAHVQPWIKKLLGYNYRRFLQLNDHNATVKNIKKIEGVINRYWWDACVLCGLFIFITLLLPFCLALFCNIESRTEWIEATSKIIIPVLAFLISLMILLRTWKQLDNQKEQLDKQVANASKQMAAEQFKNAIAHLGD